MFGNAGVFRHTIRLVCLLAAAMALIPGCRKGDVTDSTSGARNPELFAPGAWVTRGAASVTVRDAAGTEFEAMPDSRIVSVAPSATEVVFALGLGDQVVGVTTNCNYPPEAGLKDKVGDYNLSFEKIMALKPNLVIGASSFTDAAAEPLRRAGIPYFAIAQASFSDLLESVYALGVLFDKEPEAEAIVASFNAAVQEAKARSGGSRTRVFWAQWNEPLSTVGPGNFHHDLMQLAGGDNIAADIGLPYGQFSEEVLAERQPDVILVPNTDIAQWIERRFPALPAVRNHRVHVFSSDESARPGPRLPVALTALAALLHPSQ